MSDNVYVDTSVLAKWYLNETGTTEVTDYIQTIERAIISNLTITEMRCLFARRRRMNDFKDKIEHQLYGTFLNDIDRGYLVLESCSDNHFTYAAHLIDTLPGIPLRTLDALHLSIIHQQNIPSLATADEVMSKAAKKLDIAVRKF